MVGTSGKALERSLPVVATAWVTSAAEFVDASARPAPERVATLDLPDSLLAGRHAVVSVAPVA